MKERGVSIPRGALIALVIGGLLVTSGLPLRRYLDVRHNIAALNARDAGLDARAADLEKQKTLLGTDAEVERIAREHLGLVRPGEVPFFVASPPPTPAPAPVVAGEKPASAGEGLFDRWWDALGRAAHALR